MKTFKVIDDNTVEMDGVVYRKEESKPLPSEPEFKVGDWWYYPDASGLYGGSYVFRVTKVDDHVYTEPDKTASGNFRKDSTFANECRIATPAEIESHLRKICDEKYVGKMVASLVTGYRGRVFKFLDVDFAGVWYTSDNEFNLLLYENGKWAEILPDKKALPKTKDEFTAFCDKYHDQCSLPFGDSTEEFLDQYDFND